MKKSVKVGIRRSAQTLIRGEDPREKIDSSDPTLEELPSPSWLYIRLSKSVGSNE